MMEITIRPAAVADVVSIADLAGQLGYPTDKDKAAERLVPISSDPGQAFLVAEAGGTVLGWIHVHVTRLVESEPFAELGGFVVDEAHRGRGVGKNLMAAAEEWIRAHGIPKLRVRTRSDRADAHAFYEAQGYALIKQQKIYDKEM